jgi:hypothetical protein
MHGHGWEKLESNAARRAIAGQGRRWAKIAAAGGRRKRDTESGKSGVDFLREAPPDSR